MTEPMRPDDRELEQYLEGGSKLSRRYREASTESAPAELDEAILAQARAELRRKPNLNRWLAPAALAASLVLAVNLAWNLYQVEPLPAPAPASPPALAKAPAEADAAEQAVPAAPPPAPQPERRAARPPAAVAQEQKRREAESVAAQARTEGEPHALAEQKVEAANRARLQLQDAAGAAAPAASTDAATTLSEGQKIDRLIAHVVGLDGAVFIRNGKEHTPAEAAEHMAHKRREAGDRLKTADDFIRLCASFSSLSGEAYLIRFPDGQTRTAEDVLRDELARIEGGR